MKKNELELNDINESNFIYHDIVIIIFSILMAILLVKSSTLQAVLDSAQGYKFIGSFIAGIFFTSVFTTAPAIVTLGKISQFNSIVTTAFFGALGALLGDLLIFRFVKDKFSEHILELVSHRKIGKRTRALFRLRLFRWMSFLVGGLIIASPIPDEVGISLLGITKMKTSLFIIISFSFNFLGILLIGFLARTI
ncbi:hypothetical protein H0W91_01670 [Patescibacteria group bacterium]|nr:hypothetical protein [Patescibacteria group bacterium]